MNSEKKQQSVFPETRPSTFSVWTDEGGRPQFPSNEQSGISPDCFVWVDSSKSAEKGDLVLLSHKNMMTFDKVIHEGGRICLEKNPDWSLSSSEILILGVVVSGEEWITISEKGF
jgi:hypothetical protein